jgi:hypothetical protein
MVTPRTLTIADVEMGLLQVNLLHPAQPEVTGEDPETGETVVLQPARPARLRFKRAFRAVDENGDVLPEIPAQTMRLDVDFDQLPAAVANGLTAIDTLTQQRARIIAGLEDPNA